MDTIISEKYRKVQAWLDELFAGKPTPPFERTERNIEVLYELMLKNMARDREIKLVIEDLRQKATEYAAESQRIGGTLSKLTLSPGSLSQSGMTSLRSLASLALSLQTRDTSDTSYLLALTSLQKEGDRIHEELLAEKRLLDQLANKTKDAVVKHGAILQTFQELETLSKQQESKAEKQGEETSFLHMKIEQYSKHLAKLKSTLSRSGVDPSLYHENLVKKAKDLQKLEEELESMKGKLQDYHDLPADISQAKIKLAELRRNVGLLESQLSRKIDAMKL